jgi:S-DNA-T family DNA segregation ATPase FtsK/SpoIIIE
MADRRPYAAIGDDPGPDGKIPIGRDLDLLCDAARMALSHRGRIGPAVIQRKVRVGFAKAARLMILLEDYGVIGQVGPDGRADMVTTEGLPAVLARLSAAAVQVAATPDPLDPESTWER